MNLISDRRIIIPSLGWAALTFILQVGDIATASQYHLAVPAFAAYLFGLWAFDGILLIQIVIIFIVYYTRSYAKTLAKKRPQSYFEMGMRNSRRDFLQIGGTIGAFFAIAAALGIWTVLSPAESSTPPPPSGNSTGSVTTSNIPSGAVANVNNLQVGVPVYFDYPSPGYTNALIKKADGSVSALSVLCTHVCCQCQYDTSSQEYLCPCHGSIFDKNGNVVRGPASAKLPTIELSVDASGYVFPTKIVGSGPCVQGT
jgi:cytochrome b6-f complex iron-sulfur subunit